MNTIEVIIVAWEEVIRNKIRSLLTMLGVIIGVAAVIIMVSISAGTEATIEDQISTLGTNLVFVSASFGGGGGRFGPGGGGQGGGLVYADAEALVEEINGITGMAVEMPSSQTVKAGNLTLDDVSILGTTPDYPEVRDVPLARGRFFTQQDLDRTSRVAVLGYSLAQDLFGDTDPIGQTVTVGNTKLTVIGIFAEKGIVGDIDYDARIYIPITVVFKYLLPSQFARIFGDRVRIVYVEVESQEIIEDVILQIELLIARRHDLPLEELDVVVQTQQDIIQTQEATTAAFRSLLAWVAAVSLIVGGIGIMNIMLVSVTERTREIGIRQSVGATPNDIRWQFLAEALMLSLVGGFLGVLTGVGGSRLFESVGDMRTVIVPSSILLAFASAAATGIFFGFYPANKAAQMDPIEALRHE